MTRFEGGPAAGVTLTLRRAPYYLRVVTTPGEGGADALDLIDDKPGRFEEVWVYRLKQHHGSAFVDGRDASGRRFGHRCEVATYEYLETQPGKEHVRDNEAWKAWANAPEQNPPH